MAELSNRKTQAGWSSDCAAVVPCLNEAATVAALVASIRRYLPSVFVVDDGSTDATAALAAEAGAEVLTHGLSRGKGAALQTGWQAARQQGFRRAMTLDGDGQHSADDIPAFLQCAERTAAGLVVGNRMADTKSMPWLRRLVNRWMSERISRTTGCRLPDSQCGFRLMDLDLWAALPITTAHFEVESEILLAFAAADCRIEFIPIQVIYGNERSKIHPWRDTLRWFRWWRKAEKIFRSGVRGGVKPSAPAR